MNILNRVYKSVLFWVIIFQLIVTLILYKLGFRITYDPSLEINWSAVAATGQWVGALVGFLIPIAAVYLQANIDRNKNEISEANSDLYNEFIEFKTEYAQKLKALAKLVDENGNIVIDGGTFIDNSRESLKEKALKFINISMISKTKRVAEHLEITEDEAYDLLKEMVLHDGVISCGGQLRKENKNNIVWTKKNKR